MNDSHDTKAQLLVETANLRQRILEQDDQLRQAQQALHDQQQINDRLPVLLATANRDGYYTEVNAAFEEILGWSEQESLSRPFIEFIHPDDHLVAIETFEHLKSGETVSDFVDRNLCKDGSYRWITWTVIPVLDRGVVFGIGQDITERKQSEIALEQARQELEQRVKERSGELETASEQLRQAQQCLRWSETCYRTVVEDQTEVISRFKPDGTFTFANEVYCRFFGKRCEDLIGNKWQPVVVPEDLPMVEEELRTLSPGNPIVVVENRVYSGQGVPRWMQFVNRGFFDREGRLTEIQSVGRDVTDRKQAQQALERERQTLLYMLRASDHERQLISYDIHDGLAQLLGAAIMQLQIHEHLKESDSNKAKTAFDAGCELVQQAHSEARRLISGVRPPVLDEAGVAVAISHLVHEAKQAKGPQIVYYDDVEFDRLSPILENAIYRIAQEAVTNACQHSHSEKVKVSLVQEGDNLRLEILDWGKGFEPDSVDSNRFGLEGIRERTRLLGGDLTIESEPGKGTCIRVSLPIMKEK